MAARCLLATLAFLIATSVTGPHQSEMTDYPCGGDTNALSYGDFECGSPESYSPWGGLGLRSASAAYAFRRDSAVKRQGSYSGRFEVRPGDIADNTTSGERVEVRTPGGEFALSGQTRYYAFSVRFDSAWPQCTSFCNFAQWRAQGNSGTPNFRLVAPSGVTGTASDTVRVVRAAGTCSPGIDDCSIDVVHPVAALGGNSFRATLGQWHDFVMRISWHPTAGGFDLWYRPGGSSGFTRVAFAYSTATLKTINGTVFGVVDPRVGLYRGNQSLTHVLHHDSYCVSTSRAGAETCFS